MEKCQGPRSHGKTFFGFTNIWEEDVAIIPKLPGVGVARGARPPTIEMLPMIKMSQKKLLFLQFLLTSSRKTIHAYGSN